MTYFPEAPGNARLFVYAAENPLTEGQENHLRDVLKAFFEQWSSHGRKVEADAKIIEHRFLLIAAYVPGHDVSGCGIDKSVHVMDELAGELNISWAPALAVFYRTSDGTVASTSRASFKQMAAEGAVTAETPVFDHALSTVETLRTSGFEKPAHASWHARLLGHADATVS